SRCAAASGSSPAGNSPLGIDQAPSSFFAQNGPPGCTRSTSGSPSLRRNIRRPALVFAISFLRDLLRHADQSSKQVVTANRVQGPLMTARAAACAKATADGQRSAGSGWRARATTYANARDKVGRSQFTGIGGRRRRRLRRSATDAPAWGSRPV